MGAKTFGISAIGGLIIEIASLLTGFPSYLFYRAFFFKDTNPGVGFAICTTAGNAAMVPSMMAKSDPSYKIFVPSATVAAGFTVLFTAVFTPLVTHYLVNRHNRQRDSNKNSSDKNEYF